VRKALLATAAVALAVATTGFLLVRASLTSDPLEPPRCEQGPTVAGIDVSYHQAAIDWPRVRRAGIRFAFIRLSDGVTVRDPMFATNWAEARRSGVARGAYQFFRPDQSVAAQADLMIAAMRHRVPDDLPPVLDIEVNGGLAAPVVAERAAAWIARVRDQLGTEPIVYTGSDLWRGGGAEPLSSQPLWIAHYTRDCPALPAPWTRWMLWQHTDRGAIPGIEGPVDLDRLAGTLDELRDHR
jgi:lysozyme